MQTQTTNNGQTQHALKQLDKAIAATKQAAHACTNPQAKEHLEYALALVTESWIAEDGQQSRTPEIIISEVKNAFDMFDLIAGKEGK